MTYDPATGALAVIDAVPAAADPWVGGIRFTNTGQMYVITALPSPLFYIGGIAVSTDGRVFMSSSPPAYSVGGWPVAVDGSIASSGLGPVVPVAPTVTTTAATALTDTTATINGLVTSSNAATTASFEYGPTTAYGTVVAATQNPFAANAFNAPASAALTGLFAGTTYHYRILGTNSVGNAVGADMTFLTTGVQQITFVAPLMTTLVPTFAGNPSFTFGRSSLAYAMDFEGVLRNARASEARFHGARRVRNLFTATGTLATQTPTVVAGQYVISFTGTGTITYSGAASGSLVGQGSAVRAGTPPFTATAGGLVCTVTGSVTNAQLENVDGQSNQAPGEYVSVGGAAPFHGNGVDGVQYFNTTNANSIASNLFTFSQDFSQTPLWFKDRCTMVGGVAAPDGTTTAFTFADDATNGRHAFTQAPLGDLSYPANQFLANKPLTFSIYLKAGTLTWVQLQVPIPGDSAWANFNLVTGLVGNSASVISRTMIALPNGWYRCSMTVVPSDDVSGLVGALSCLSDINHLDDVYTGTGQTMLVWGAQVEISYSPSPYTVTTATRVQGIVVEAVGLPLPTGPFAPVNMLAQSQAFTQPPAWTPFGATLTPNAIAAPDGTMTGTLMTESLANEQHRFYQFIGGFNNAIHTASFHFKAGTAQWVQLIYYDGNFHYANFDLINGVIGNRDTLPGGSASMTAVGNGWYRCSVTFVQGGSGNVSPYMIPSNITTTNTAYPGTGKTLYVWGAQYEQAGAASTYAPTGSAANYTAMLGCVMENAATNICLQSQTFETVFWTKPNATTTSNAQIAPDGTLTADTFTDNATNLAHYVAQQGLSTTSGTAYTLSLYVKRGTLPWMQLLHFDGSTSRWANFNLATGEVGNSSGAVGSSVALSNGWFRVTITVTSGATGITDFYILGSLTNSAAALPAYVGTGQTMFLWGAQMEAGPDASTYIPTTTVAVSRGDDQLSYPVPTNISGVTGTLYTEQYFPTPQDPKTQVVHRFWDNVTSPQFYAAPPKKLFSQVGVSLSTTNARYVGVLNKAATAWGGATESMCLNGDAVAAIAGWSPPPNTGVMYLGCDGYLGNAMAGILRNVNIQNVRLSDAQLVTNTTLAVPPPTFDAPLTKSLIPAACGNYLPTFVRSSLAMVPDFEGVLRNCALGEARFAGARRVQNFVPTDMSVAAWSVNVTSARTTGVADPNGGTTAITLTFTNGGPTGALSWQQNLLDFGLRLRNSIWMRRRTGTGIIRITGPDSVLVDVTAVLTAAWQRITVPSTFGGTLSGTTSNYGFGIQINTLGDAVDLWQPQMELSGVANDAPSDFLANPSLYVNPFQGSGADGVKCYDTTNGNSVVNSVVVPGVGTPIPAATLLGYLVENPATNLVLQSQTFDNAAWTKSDAVVTPNTQVAPDGTLTADTFADNANSVGHGIFNGATTTATPATTSLYIKAGTMQWVQLSLRNSIWANFNPSTGTIGFVAAGCTASVVALPNGWYRLSVTGTATTSSVPSVYGLNANTNSYAPVYVGTGATVFIWGMQVEQTSYPTTYIPTTTVTVTRNEDVVSYPMFRNLTGAQGTTYVETMLPYASALTRLVFRLSGPPVGAPQYYQGAGQLTFFAQGANGAITNAATPTARNKNGSSWDAAGSSICVTGVALVTGPSGTPPVYVTAGTAVMGSAPDAPGLTLQGYMKNVKFYSVRLPNPQLQGLTT
jgi:hypothetical protein